MSSFWSSIICCPRKDSTSDKEVNDGGLGGTQPVYETDMKYAPSIHSCVQDSEILQHATPSLHGPEPALGLQDADLALDLPSLEAPMREPPDPQVEMMYEKRIQDLEDELNLMLRRNKELSSRVCELEDLMCPEVERSSWAESQPSDRYKAQLGKSLKEKRQQERRALKAEETLRDLKHQNAVLLKRLHQAGSRSPGHFTSPPRPPPLPPGSVGPMFSVLRNATVKWGPPISEQPGETSGLANGEPGQHSPSAMNEVLEKIRHGVPLRPVTPPQKSAVPLAGGGDLDSAAGRAKCHLDGMLGEQQAAAAELMLDGPSTSAMSPVPTHALPGETMEMRQSPGKDDRGNRSTVDREIPYPVRELGEPSGSARSTDDEGSTSSTLPATSDHSAEEDDRSSKPDLCRSVSSSKGLTELPHSAPGGLGRVSHVLTTAQHEPCAEQKPSPDQSVLILLPDPSSDETESVGHTEIILPLVYTNCVGPGPALLDAFCEPKLEQLSEGNDRSTTSHTDAASALAMDARGIPEEGNTDLALVTSQKNGGLEHFQTEEILVLHTVSTQEHILEMNVDSLEGELDGKDEECSPESGERPESSLVWYMASEEELCGISPPKYGCPPETTSSPKPGNLPLADGPLEFPQLVGPVQLVEIQAEDIDRTVAHVSKDNDQAGLKSHDRPEGDPTSIPCEAHPSGDVPEPASETTFF